MSRYFGSAFVLCLISALSLPISAAAQSAPIGGVVVDATGGAIRGASVTLRAGSPAISRETVSDSAGRFVFDSVPPGPATVTVAIAKFEPVTVDVRAGRAALRVVLQPAALVEAVTVRAPSQNATRVTSATKTATPLRDVPQAISVVTRDAIADQQMRSLADVAQYIPGVGFAQGEGHRDTPIFRGNSSTSDFFVDGVRDDVEYFRDLYNVERVEAIKGPNAMIFGRGGVGGVINRVSRQAEWMPIREVGLQAGSFDTRRITADLGNALNRTMSARVTAMFEDSGSYRNGADLTRRGINPTVAFALGANTRLRAGYEYFHDERTVDRGIPSFNGRPVVTDVSTFFGNPDVSESVATVNVLSSSLEHALNGRVTLRNRISYGDYDKYYQNVYPGAVDSTGTIVSISGYTSGMKRKNLFNQTDLLVSARTRRVEHDLVFGLELGRQITDNLRTTGYFGSVSATTTSVSVPIAAPTTSLRPEWRPSATDPDNHGVATVAAAYAQDQVTISRHIQAVVGLRYESLNVDFRNNRTQQDFSSNDGLVSPRAGLVIKPIAPLSLYASYTLSYLPRAGQQLSSLSLTNQALDPEEFRNYEVGAKWDLAPSLSLTMAVYRLDRGNVIAPDPVNPAVSVLVDAQNTKGFELGLTGNITPQWSVAGAYAYQNGEITRSLSATAQAGAKLAQLPANSFSLWNKYDVTRLWSVGLGVIHRSDIFTSTDNTVTLPRYTRADAAVFFNVSPRIRAQLNVENLFDASYYLYAHSNTNITPGSPRAVRVMLTTHF